MEPSYDIFISYRTVNRPLAQRIRDSLTARGRRVYLDDDMRLGTPLFETLSRLIHGSRSVLLLIGPEDMGTYQQTEIGTAISLAHQQDKTIITVLLPGAEIPPQWSVLHRWTLFHATSELSDEELDRLYVGIYGKLNSAPAPHAEPASAPAKGDAVQNEVAALAKALQTGPVTFYLGERASHELTRFRPNSYLLAHRLFREVELIEDSYEHFLPTYDVAGLFYATTRADPFQLQEAVSQVLAEDMVDMPRTHVLLARLLAALRRPRPRLRSRGVQTQLVVTTNLDLWTERALLSARVPFTRIVQMPGTEDVQWQVTKYTAELMERVPDSVGAGYLEKLDQLLETPEPEEFDISADRPEERASGRGFQLGSYPQPILYKYHGSQDLPGSCTISTDQFIDSAKRSHVPEDIRNVIGNTPALFLGYRLLDPPFRHLHRTLLRAAFQGALADHRKVMVCSPPGGAAGAYRLMETKNWNITRSAAVTVGISSLEAWPADFLEAMLDETEGAR